MFFSSLLKRRALNIFGALLVLASVFAVSSCSQVDDDDPIIPVQTVPVIPTNPGTPSASGLPAGVAALTSADSIIGKWQDNYPGWNTYSDCDYIISATSMGTASYEQHDTTVYIKKISATSGYLYYQLQKNITGYDSSYNQITVPSKGKWCATAYKDLTAASVKMNDAYKASSTYDFPSSLEECVTKYTIENGYFNSLETTVYTKVEAASGLPAGVAALTSADSIIGKWQDNYPGWNTYSDCDYIISATSMGTASYEQHDTTVYIKKISATSGYLYYQLQKDITGYDSSYNQITVPSKGKWCATAYKDLTAASVKMNDAYKASSTYDFPSSLEECVTKYTIENGYFNSLETTVYTKVQ